MAKLGYIGLYQAILNEQRIVHRYFVADSYCSLLVGSQDTAWFFYRFRCFKAIYLHKWLCEPTSERGIGSKKCTRDCDPDQWTCWKIHDLWLWPRFFCFYKSRQREAWNGLQVACFPNSHCSYIHCESHCSHIFDMVQLTKAHTILNRLITSYNNDNNRSRNL